MSPLGTRREASATERIAQIRTVLPEQAPGYTPEETLKALPEDTPSSAKTVKRDLATGVERGDFASTGRGVKGDPFRYHLIDDSIPDNSNPYEERDCLEPYGGESIESAGPIYEEPETDPEEPGTGFL